jgi:hypothetical protein
MGRTAIRVSCLIRQGLRGRHGSDEKTWHIGRYGRLHDVAAVPTGVNRSPRSSRQRAVEHLRALGAPYRFRVRTDPEGLPIIWGRYGQIEWHCDGGDCWSCPLAGQVALAVYSDRPRLFQRLWAIPGVRHHQTGDTEMRAVFPPEALEQVAVVVRARRRRQLSSDAARKLGSKTAYRSTSGG